jgi:N-carbamoylputrescine amidase
VLGLNGAEIVFIPAATSRGSTEHLWRIEQPNHAIANGYFVGSANRVGVESGAVDTEYFGQSYFCDPRGQVCGEYGDAHMEGLVIRDLDLDLIKVVRDSWQFYRDRRPEMYDKITEA